MMDSLDVWVAGNLRADVQLVAEDGVIVAHADVCTTYTELVQGVLRQATVTLPMRIRGSSHAYAFAQLNEQGSRVVLRGTLRHEPAHGLVLLVEHVLADGATLRHESPHASHESDAPIAAQQER